MEMVLLTCLPFVITGVSGGIGKYMKGNTPVWEVIERSGRFALILYIFVFWLAGIMSPEQENKIYNYSFSITRPYSSMLSIIASVIS